MSRDDLNSLMTINNTSDTITLTQEQMKIVQHAISVGDIIKIIAFAGK